TLRNQQRKISVLVVGGLEPLVEFALEDLPHRVPIGFDDHATLNDFSGFGHVALQYDILIPGGKVLRARGDWRFSHMRCNLQCGITVGVVTRQCVRAKSSSTYVPAWSP